MASKLYLNQDLIDEARNIAAAIADDVALFIADKTTVATERTVLRLLGLDGVDAEYVPLPNVVVDHIHERGHLQDGIAHYVLNGIIQTGLSIQELGEAVAQGTVDLLDLPVADEQEITALGERMADETLAMIRANRERRDQYVQTLGEGPQPYIYVIVATGNIYEDVIQARAAARQGADIIAVIRSTGQSLIDYVPYGATTEGFGGTYATQENFKIMRGALDEVGEEIGRYIRLCNYCSGLCMPEIAAMGALERLDVMLNDALYGILFRDINMQRTLIDQNFSRMINAYAGVIINTGEDNYLTTADAVEAAHTVLASQLINEQLAFRSGLRSDQLGLGHAFEMNPTIEDGFLMEWAQALMAREIFPDAPLKYMPPTKHMTGNIFRGHVQDALFNLIGVATGQGIQLLGMMTEAIHTPLIHDRQIAIESAKYIFNNARHLQDEIEFKRDGIMVERASKVLLEAVELLRDIAQKGLFNAISEGLFADVKRTLTGGKGLKGVLVRSAQYSNPLETALRDQLGLQPLEELMQSRKQNAAGRELS
ncbi:MAG: lysine 5,6-aminomutase subunit alpha [Acidibacillus sp.]|uniref:Lysine 5,6-aminomutase alpha subunit n=1 Tax=Sulfoacidibacillus ferrooxidans TaxID=2005001 RepID=A0A9X1V8T3_9BACL|nr:Lysine 5,6-aminomutase alpha subunit [Sulfoacidibacillus ferrooxidans]MCY0893991.1 lysine 5,6-aminomutase subunit alpha [Acidibacillus sp.]